MDSILGSLRLKDWYASKVPLLTSIGIYLLTIQNGKTEVLQKLVAFLVFYMCLMGFGYAANDWLDFKSDSLADKRTGKNQSLFRISLLLLVLILVGLICVPTPLWQIKVAAAGIFVLAFLYSAPPIRFKELDVAGLIVSPLVQLSLPALLFFVAFQENSRIALVVVCWYSLIGLRWILIHQISDYSNDQKSNTRTFTITHGILVAKSLITYLIFPLEAGLLFVSLFLLRGAGFRFLFFGLLGYVLWEFGMMLARFRVKLPVTMISYDWIPFADYYQIFWPFSLAISLAIRYPQFMLMPPLVMLMQYKYIRKQIIIFHQLCKIPNH